ncbi:N-acetylmuramoyl-L-alanine amidase [Puia sp. P3]|uniref:N-acetylmuramoyl-L-alanine amidase n=1 Tax=Puia sp. P3 TaxID=3423952 RepID=UPI003D670B9C
MLNDYLRAWQAGVSKWGNITDVNSISIGIELDNNGIDSFPDAQITSLLHLLTRLKTSYNIPRPILSDTAISPPPARTTPISASRGNSSPTAASATGITTPTGVVPPDNFSSLTALRLIGYDVRDSSAAALAFKRHFEQDTLRCWGDADKKILYSLYTKY